MIQSIEVTPVFVRNSNHRVTVRLKLILIAMWLKAAMSVLFTEINNFPSDAIYNMVFTSAKNDVTLHITPVYPFS